MRSIVPMFAFAAAVAAPLAAAEPVPVAPFRSVELRGGGEVVVRPGPVQRATILEGSSRFTELRVGGDGKLRIDICNGRCPRHYRLRVQIESPQVPDLGISGGGVMRVTPGFAAQQRLSAAVNGGGHVDVDAVEATHVSAAVNGGGRVTVRPRQTLSAVVNGGGEVRYAGNPRVSSAIQGGGTIRRSY